MKGTVERTWLLTCHATVASSPPGPSSPAVGRECPSGPAFAAGTLRELLPGRPSYIEWHGLDAMRVGLLFDKLRTSAQERGLQRTQLEIHCVRWSQLYYATKTVIPKRKETLLNQKTKAQSAAQTHCSTHPAQVSIRNKFRRYD